MFWNVLNSILLLRNVESNWHSMVTPRQNNGISCLKFSFSCRTSYWLSFNESNGAVSGDLWACIVTAGRGRWQNRDLRTIGNFTRRTPTRALHLTFQIPYLYDYKTKISRKQAEIIQNHNNVNVRNVCKSEAQHRKYKRLKLGGGQASKLS
jgi:hypothetical protein